MAEHRRSNRDGAAGIPVAARELTRRYGEGATAVEALRGVDLDVRQASSSR